MNDSAYISVCWAQFIHSSFRQIIFYREAVDLVLWPGNVGPYASFQLSICQSTLPELFCHLTSRNGLACPVQNATWLLTHVLKSWTVLDVDGMQSHQLLPCSFQGPVAEKRQEIQQEVRRESLVGQKLLVLHLGHPVWGPVGARPPASMGMSLNGILGIKTH